MARGETTVEVIKVGKTSYSFRFDFNALREFDEERGNNIYQVAEKLASRETLPAMVREILEVSLEKIDGKEVLVGDAIDEAETFIHEAGFQTAHVVAQELISFVLIGGEKKRELQRLGQGENLLQVSLQELTKVSMSAFPSMSFTSRLWLWGLKMSVFGVLVWLILSDFGLRSLLKMV